MTGAAEPTPSGEPTASTVAPDDRLTAGYRSVADVDDRLIAAWHDLAATAVEPNAYLAPCFALPAVEELGRPTDVYIVTAWRAERGGADRRLCGLALVTRRWASAVYPLPHLSAYKSPHSYLTGMLVDADDPGTTVEALVVATRAAMPRAAGLHLSDLPSAGTTARQLRDLASRRGWQWLTVWERERPILDVTELRSSERWDGHISSNRRKKYRRSLRQLAEQGELTWAAKQGPDVTDDDVHRFLELEHTGWKAKHGTSLLSTEANRRFFDRLADSSRAKGELFLTELRLDGVAIASTCNFLSGSELFAFKIGWEPSFSRFSPGIVNELKLLEYLAGSSDEVTRIDSGATETSFIGAYWPGRKRLESAIVSFGPVAHGAARLAAAGRHASRGLKGAGRAAVRRREQRSERPERGGSDAG